MRTGTHSEASHTGEALSTGLYLCETGPRSYASQEAGCTQAPHSGGAVDNASNKPPAVELREPGAKAAGPTLGMPSEARRGGRSRPQEASEARSVGAPRPRGRADLFPLRAPFPKFRGQIGRATRHKPRAATYTKPCGTRFRIAPPNLGLSLADRVGPHVIEETATRAMNGEAVIHRGSPVGEDKAGRGSARPAPVRAGRARQSS